MAEDTRRAAIRAAIERELRARKYDRHPASPDIWEETLDDVTEAVIVAIT